MNTIEQLLSLDANKLELPKREVEVTRLSDLTGKKVIFKLQGLDTETVDSIREMSIKENSVSTSELRAGFILAGVKEPNLRDPALLKKFGVPTPPEVVNKLLLPGERDTLFEEISDLSGFGEGTVTKQIEEIKN
jgi:hypothetical protein